MNQVSHLGAQRICVHGTQISCDRRGRGGGSHQKLTFTHRGEEGSGEGLNLLM